MKRNKAMLALIPAALLAAGLQAAGPVGTVSAAPSPTGHEVGMHFTQYYRSHDGLRLLGYAVSDESLLEDASAQRRVNIPAQYFQKGRIEYHGNMGQTGPWEYMYGLLVPEMLNMVDRSNDVAISNTSISYLQLKPFAQADQRVAPPAGFKGGTQRMSDVKNVFIPYSPTLAAAPGYLVPTYFWDYMNSGVFPAGWLHDLGLPVSVPFQGTVMKDNVERGVSLQAFERGILSYDAQNPASFKVERANVGADYMFMTKQIGQGQTDAMQRAQNIVTTYWRAIDEKNYAAAYEMLSASYKAQVSLQQFSQQMAGAVQHATGVRFTSSTLNQDTSVTLGVEVTIQAGAQSTNFSNGVNALTISLVNENGAWRIASIASGPQGGQGGGTLLTIPAQMAVNYWQDIDAGRYKDAWLRLSSAYQQKLGGYEAYHDATVAAIAHVSNVKVIDGKQQADGSMLLTLNLTVQVGSQPSNFTNGENTRFMKLVQEGGSWKIADITTGP